jgi:hypothetical protein
LNLHVNGRIKATEGINFTFRLEQEFEMRREVGHWNEVNTAQVNELDRKGISAYFP